jgi:hypothetical protein
MLTLACRRRDRIVEREVMKYEIREASRRRRAAAGRRRPAQRRV